MNIIIITARAGPYHIPIDSGLHSVVRQQFTATKLAMPIYLVSYVNICEFVTFFS